MDHPEDPPLNTRQTEQAAGPPRPRLIIFYAETNGPSRRVDGYLAQVLQRNQNHDTFEIIRVDAERRPDLVDRLRVTTIPELLVVEGRKVRSRIRKPRGAAQLADALTPWLRR